MNDDIFEATDGSRCPECGSTRMRVLDQTVDCADCPWVYWGDAKPRIPAAGVAPVASTPPSTARPRSLVWWALKRFFADLL